MKYTYEQMATHLTKEISEMQAKRDGYLEKLNSWGFGRTLWDLGTSIIKLDVGIAVSCRVLNALQGPTPIEGLKSIQENVIELVMRGPEMSSSSQMANAVAWEEYQAYREAVRDMERWMSTAKVIEENK